MPELGLKQSTYLDEVDADEEEQTEELYLRLPSDALSGTYDLVTEVSYDNGYRSVESQKTAVTVVGKTVKEEVKAEQKEPAQTTVNVNVQPAQPEPVAQEGKLRRGLEVVLLVLVALLVVIGLIIGFSKLRDEEDDE
ncbi:hypothetical protein COV11_04965 [Candidatus Woesearchaeota archaeon CG10_big_fil_rev_8_21_14_0_10_30_7]|nr:MAG: hypothetical protein COV11_04965 [Candidatus Woesearchaeota archaeon CG10_big_fil_rev_8_21_14_0_10_30_7]